MPALTRRYDEASARAEYMQHLQDLAATQNLSQDLRPRTMGLTIAFTVFATVVVVMRFLSRRKQGALIMTDDWLTVFSLLLLFGNMAINVCLIQLGVGLHIGAIPYEQLARLNKMLIGAEILYFTAVNMFKISLLFLFFRIFPIPSVRKWGMVLGAMSVGWNVACIFAAIFQCVPQEKLWKPWLEGSCIDLFLTQLCVSVPVILLDICILLLPLPQVWRLNMNRTQKVFLTIIFLLGSYVVFTSIYRFVIFLSYNNDDFSYTLGDGIAWNIIEISSGIISGCLPTLGALVRPLFTGLTSMTSVKSKYARAANGAYSSKDPRNNQVDIVAHSSRNTQDNTNDHFGSGVMLVPQPLDVCLELNSIDSSAKDARGDEYPGIMDDELPLATNDKERDMIWAVYKLKEIGSSSEAGQQ